MTRKCGFTLVEILTSLALLSLVVAGCLPFLTAGAAKHDTSTGIVVAELGLIADELLAPDAETPLDLEEIPSAPDFVTIERLVDEENLIFRVGRLDPNAEAPPHFWLRVEHGSTAVYRWVPSPEAAETPGETP